MPAFGARLKERNLVAQIVARDEEIGRWFEIRDGKITSRRGLHKKPDVTLAFKNAAARRRAVDAADQLARPDQRAEGFQSHHRRAGGPVQLVRADHHAEPDGRLENGHAASRRQRALLQHDERRAGLRHRQGRQDRAHDADRFRRRRSAAMDDRGARREIHAAAQDNAGAARAEREIDRLFARSPAASDEARRLRSQRRAQSAKSRQVRLRANFLGRGARPRRRRDQAAEARHMAPA